MFFVPHDWRLALATVLLAGAVDVILGEPPNALHPVVWMGRLIGALMRRRPRGRPRAEFAYGVLIVLVTAGAAFAAGLLLTLGLERLPWWLALPVGACALKTTFSLRGLVRAGRDVQRALAGVFDIAFGEPPNALHPVAWMGRLIALLERHRPRGRPQAELAYGALIVLVACGVAGGVGFALLLAVHVLPFWAALPLASLVLKMAFSLRGLAVAGRTVQRRLGTDIVAARAGVTSLVSRDPEMEPPQIVSATVESLAENLTDSVVSPLLSYALFGLPGALAYRAINTMDAMVGYRDEREYVGKAAARCDDAANWLPTRIAALLLVAIAALKRTARAAWAALRTQHRPEHGPNKTLAIATMAGALGVQLQKPGAYALGWAERPLTADVIGDAAWFVWVAGGATIAGAAGLAALLSATVRR